MSLVSIISMILAGILTENIVFSQSLGICPFLGVSKKTDSAVSMGIAVTFVLLLASLVCYVIYNYLLVPFKIEYLQTITFILIIAVLVQVLDIVLKKVSPSLYNALGVYLALITTNCAVLGTANNVISNGFTVLQTLIHSVSVGLGFTLALILMACVREKMERNEKIPRFFKGLPIALITAGLMAMAFAGFSGFTIGG